MNSANDEIKNKVNGVTQKQLQEDALRRVVALRLRVVGQTQLHDPASLELKPGDDVLIETENGSEIGTVLTAPTSVAKTKNKLPAIDRLLGENDEQDRKLTKAREKEVFEFCKSEIKTKNLAMKLISAHITHNRSHGTFYFTASLRVDFRALIKTLAQQLKMRISMRQIGVRDAARHTGGTGICGRELCCSTWIPEFKPISIRMAKEQNLTLNNLKLSGVCGRLRCCLEYEHNIYKKARKGLPKLNRRVTTPKGEGRTRDINVLKRTVRVQLDDGTMDEFPTEVITPVPPQQGISKQSNEKPKKSPPHAPKDNQASSSPKRDNRRQKPNNSKESPNKTTNLVHKDSPSPKNSDKDPTS